MFQYSLKIVLRNIFKHRTFSFVNILGLSIGLGCCIMIMLWVFDELSYDRFNQNSDRIYRLWLDANFGSPFRAAITMAPAAPLLAKEFPEVEAACRLSRPNSSPVKCNDELFQEELVGYADNEVFEIFTFEFLRGNPEKALEAPYTVVITEEMAEKYFGGDNPLGRTLKIGGVKDYTVTGIVKKLPDNSHFRFNMLRSMETMMAERRADMEAWFNIQYYTYILLAENADYKVLESKLPGFIDNYMGEVLSSIGAKLDCYLQPVTGIHLHSDLSAEISDNGDIVYVWVFTAIALFVMLMACVNFVNLTTARAAVRMKEIGVRKTCGANRISLLKQFLTEALIYSLISLIIALFLVELSLPLFNHIISKELTVWSAGTPWLIIVYIGLMIFTALLAGIYPALYLSTFSPLNIIKSGPLMTGSKSLFRKILVAFQFTVSIALIISTFVIYSQIKFMKDKNLGFNDEMIVVVPQIYDAIKKSLPSVKEELKSISGVLGVTASSTALGSEVQMTLSRPEGYPEEKTITMNLTEVDEDFIPVLGMELVQGRNFNPEITTDALNSIIINQAAAENLGWENPIGKTIYNTMHTDTGGVALERTIIGVVRDFHITSLHRKIEPMIIGNTEINLKTLLIRISAQNIEGTLNSLKEKWGILEPARPFNYFFLDESFDKRYKTEERLENLAFDFSLLAIFIGCLGLFGMASYTIERRTKEIGIRKVLGASVSGIVNMLSKEFLIQVAAANLIAWPLAYLLVQQWLANFAYKIGFGEWFWIYPAAGMVAILIAALTVSYQSIRAARANPVDSLRYE